MKKDGIEQQPIILKDLRVGERRLVEEQLVYAKACTFEKLTKEVQGTCLIPIPVQRTESSLICMIRIR